VNRRIDQRLKDSLKGLGLDGLPWAPEHGAFYDNGPHAAVDTSSIGLGSCFNVIVKLAPILGDYTVRFGFEDSRIASVAEFGDIESLRKALLATAVDAKKVRDWGYGRVGREEYSILSSRAHDAMVLAKMFGALELSHESKD
jgi:hypothetical protein